jgi:hypothetical protein
MKQETHSQNGQSYLGLIQINNVLLIIILELLFQSRLSKEKHNAREITL